tara:strand:+ start:388 stop:1122 length:735 start_codon:yes stop_codon:yes gene_type:complete
LGTPCVNCGEAGAHFVPPSFGEEGYFTCEAKKDKDMDAEHVDDIVSRDMAIESKHGIQQQINGLKEKVEDLIGSMARKANGGFVDRLFLKVEALEQWKEQYEHGMGPLLPSPEDEVGPTIPDQDLFDDDKIPPIGGVEIEEKTENYVLPDGWPRIIPKDMHIGRIIAAAIKSREMNNSLVDLRENQIQEWVDKVDGWANDYKKVRADEREKMREVLRELHSSEEHRGVRAGINLAIEKILEMGQ